MKSTHIETVAIHGSMRAQKAENSPIVPGIELSTIYEHAKDGHREGDLKYSRLENPNRLELEAVLSDLEKGAEAAALPKGSDPKEESMQLLELMGQSGVLDSSVLGEILGNVRDTIEVSSENIVEEEDGTVVVSVEEA